uniref:Uncharacterized protein n=1 Tax=Catagonus wagneri TaxID=51154 RepID=A0A8C3X6H9_9CETA
MVVSDLGVKTKETICCVLLWNTASKKHQAGVKHKADCSAEVSGFLLVSSTLVLSLEEIYQQLEWFKPRASFFPS